MIFKNISPVPVIIQVDEREFHLDAQDTLEIPCAATAVFVFKHTYKSTALSAKEIATDLSNDSVVSMAVASYHEPYFKIALDGRYALQNNTDRTILIQRQYLSPAYGIMYDRLYPITDSTVVLSESYTYAERDEYVKRYRDASKKHVPSKRVLAKAFKILTILAIPFLALATWRAGVLGFLGAALLLGLAVIPCAVMWGLAKLEDSVDQKWILPHFEYEQIKQNFLKEQNSPRSRIEID